MPQSPLKEAANNLANILSNPLILKDGKDPLSLIEAGRRYGEGEHSDLSKLLTAFAHNPETIRALLQELEFISRNLIS
jgi:hypothetical protein